jgi:hypothetical protein
MALIPHIADVERWTKHFVNMAGQKSLPKQNFYVVGKEEPLIKLVSPTAQTVQRAKALMTAAKVIKRHRQQTPRRKPKKATSKPKRKTKPKSIKRKSTSKIETGKVTKRKQKKKKRSLTGSSTHSTGSDSFFGK